MDVLGLAVSQLVGMTVTHQSFHINNYRCDFQDSAVGQNNDVITGLVPVIHVLDEGVTVDGRTSPAMTHSRIA
jgi:hypothetical protein